MTGVAGVDLAVSGDRERLIDAEVQVAVDFTEAGAARHHVMWLAEHGIHAVVGTTGFTDGRHRELPSRRSPRPTA